MAATQPQNEIALPLEPTIVLPPPLPKRVKVKVSAKYVPTSTHPLPTLRNTILAMGSADRRQMNRWLEMDYDLPTIMRDYGSRLSTSVWADAIAAATIRQLSHAIDTEAEMSQLGQGGYLAVGDAVYRLSCVGVQPTNKVLAAVRKSVMEKAKHESLLIVADTRQACRTLTEKARIELDKARQMLDEQKRAGKIVPPSWAVNHNFMVRYINRWEIGWWIHFKPTWLEYIFITEGDNRRTLKWATLQGGDGVRVVVWLPLEADGKYNQTSLKVDIACKELPHISHASACFKLATAPNAITDLSSMVEFQHSFANCMNTINLGDLMRFPESWDANLRAMIPPLVLEQITVRRREDIHINMARPTTIRQLLPMSDITTNSNEEARSTWTR